MFIKSIFVYKIKMISECIVSIMEDLNQQMITEEALPNLVDLQRQLYCLNNNEKDYIRSQMIRADWNVGGRRVFALLQSVNIITITDYLLASKTDQLVMADLFEAEFTLLANVTNYLRSNHPRVTIIHHILRQSYKAVIYDIKTRPEVIKVNYWAQMVGKVNYKALTMMLQVHLALLIESESISIYGALVELDKWFSEEIPLAMHAMLSEILTNEHCIETMIEMANTSYFTGWKYYCIFLRVMSEVITDGISLRFKTFLKMLFKQFLKSKNKTHLYVFMLTGRLLTRSSPHKFGTYKDWYKKSIGEMNYIITKDQFVDVINALQDMVHFETDIAVLQVHATVSISAPPRCHYFVTLYKQVCRTQIAEKNNL